MLCNTHFAHAKNAKTLNIAGLKQDKFFGATINDQALFLLFNCFKPNNQLIVIAYEITFEKEQEGKKIKKLLSQVLEELEAKMRIIKMGKAHLIYEKVLFEVARDHKSTKLYTKAIRQVQEKEEAFLSLKVKIQNLQNEILAKEKAKQRITQNEIKKIKALCKQYEFLETNI